VFNSAKAVVLLFNIVDHSGAEGGICLELASSFDHRRVVQKVDQLEGLHLAVKDIEFSEDDRYLAVCSTAEEVYVYDTTTQKLQWRLPQFTNSVSSLKFIRPPHVAKTSAILFVLLSNNSFLMFDVTQKKLHTWSETNGVDKIPKYILQMPGSLSGIALNESNHDKLILYGQGYCVLINLSDKIPTKPRILSQCTTALMQKNMSKKRKATRSEDSTDSVASLAAVDVGTNFVVVNIYRNLLHVGCLKNDELVRFFLKFFLMFLTIYFRL
jgi:WD40 repeat protein